MKTTVVRAKWERCALSMEIEGSAALRWVRDDGAFFDCGESIDFASGFGGRPIPDGVWRLQDAAWAPTEPLTADFSGDGTAYTVRVADGEIRVHYIPKRASLPERTADLVLQLLYALGRYACNKDTRVLFTSESRREVGGNMAAVLDAAKRDGLLDNTALRFSFYGGHRAVFYAKTAFLLGQCDTVVVDDYYPLLYHLRFARKVRVFQLWHACGAFKTVGYSRAGKRGAPRIDGPVHRCYTHVTVSSEAVRPYYAEAFGVTPDNVLATGVPRTDLFFDRAHIAQQRRAFFDAYPQAQGKKILLLVPTFRGDGKETAQYPFARLQTDALAQACREHGWFAVFKMHPFVKGFSLPAGNDDVFADATALREVNDLLLVADRVVTDYSSVIYEASLTDADLLFYVFDLDAYVATRDFYEPFSAYAAGDVVTNPDDFVQAAVAPLHNADKRLAFRERNMSACDGGASSRVAALIFKKRG